MSIPEASTGRKRPVMGKHLIGRSHRPDWVITYGVELSRDLGTRSGSRRVCTRRAGPSGSSFQAGRPSFAHFDPESTTPSPWPILLAAVERPSRPVSAPSSTSSTSNDSTMASYTSFIAFPHDRPLTVSPKCDYMGDPNNRASRCKGPPCRPVLPVSGSPPSGPFALRRPAVPASWRSPSGGSGRSRFAPASSLAPALRASGRGGFGVGRVSVSLSPLARSQSAHGRN